MPVLSSLIHEPRRESCDNPGDDCFWCRYTDSVLITLDGVIALFFEKTGFERDAWHGGAIEWSWNATRTFKNIYWELTDGTNSVWFAVTTNDGDVFYGKLVQKRARSEQK